MEEKVNAQTPGKREIKRFDREFARLHLNSCAITEGTPADILYLVPEQTGMGPGVGQISATSIGESILRCAAAIEQTFGGITANLWDDPFEWTLPEYLSTSNRIIEHLAEVEATRRRAFNSFGDDTCLSKQVMIPSGEPQALIDLLRETLIRATQYQDHALVLLRTLSGISPPGFII